MDKHTHGQLCECNECNLLNDPRRGCLPDPKQAFLDSEIAVVQPIINRLGEFCIRTPEKGEIERIIAKSVRCEPIRYPEEVKMNGIAAQLRREMAKGKVTGHFC